MVLNGVDINSCDFVGYTGDDLLSRVRKTDANFRMPDTLYPWVRFPVTSGAKVCLIDQKVVNRPTSPMVDGGKLPSAGPRRRRANSPASNMARKESPVGRRPSGH